MKLAKLFVLSSAGVLAASVAQAAPQVYGAIYANADVTHTKTTKTYLDGTVEKESGVNRPRVYDNASRIGIRGSEALNDQVDVQYRIEWRSPFDVNTRTLEPRDAWIGLAHKKYGTVKAGRMLTYDAYLNEMPWGRPAAMDGLRVNNSIRYESPVINGNQATFQYIMDENKDGTTAGTDSINGDGYAVTLNRSTDKYSIGAAYVYADADDKSDHRGVMYVGQPIKDAIRVSGFYQATPTVKFTGMYQQNRFNGTQYDVASKTEKALAVGLIKKLDDKDEIYSQVNLFDNPDGKDGNRFDVIFGAKRDFSSKVYGGVELAFYNTKVDVPTHQVTNSDKTVDTVNAHELKENTSELVFYTGVRF